MLLTETRRPSLRIIDGYDVGSLSAKNLLALVACKAFEVSQCSGGVVATYGQIIDAIDRKPLNLPLQDTLLAREILILRSHHNNTNNIRYAVEAGFFGHLQAGYPTGRELLDARGRHDFPTMLQLLSNVKVFVAENPVGERYVPFWQAVRL